MSFSYQKWNVPADDIIAEIEALDSEYQIPALLRPIVLDAINKYAVAAEPKIKLNLSVRGHIFDGESYNVTEIHVDLKYA